MSIVLLVGDEPSSKNLDPNTTSHKTLLAWIQDLGIRHYHIVNRIDPDFQWWIEAAQRQALPVIALGNTAHKACNHVKSFKLPHPSPRNRSLNNPELVQKKLKSCRVWLTKLGY